MVVKELWLSSRIVVLEKKTRVGLVVDMAELWI